MGSYRWGTPAVQAVQAARELSGEETGRVPVILAYHPVARMNPFQAMLYSSAWDSGIAPIPLHRFDDLPSVAEAGAVSGARTVFHLHWTNEITRKARSEDEAQRLADVFLEEIRRFREAGGRFVWTVHNVMPHRYFHPAVEARLRQEIAYAADLIHVMASATVELTAPHYEIPTDKVVSIPHPSYTEAYPSWMSKRQARFELEIGFDELVWGFVGEVRPNKGLHLIADALAEIAARDATGAYRLLFAGKHSDDMDGELLQRFRCHPWVSTWPSRIPHDDMQTFLRASDVILLPYAESLNSGIAHLAASMGRPIIAPNAGGFTELLENMPGIAYEPNNTESLADAMLAAGSLTSDTVEAAVVAFAHSRRPEVVSHAFVEQILRIAAEHTVCRYSRSSARDCYDFQPGERRIEKAIDQ